MKKIVNNKGESLIETLVAILVVSLCFVMLATGIVTAAKINNATKNMDTEFTNDKTADSFTVSIDRSGTTSEVAVTPYVSNGYYYYEK